MEEHTSSKNMKQDLFDSLKSNFPQLYSQLHSIDCDDGWYSLIYGLSNTIEFHLEYLPPDLKGKIFAVQVKEKFGGLRFYLNHGTPYIDGAVQMAEAMSYCTCETCGNKGSQRNVKGYVFVACDIHYEEKKASRI